MTTTLDSLALAPVSSWYGHIVDVPVQLIKPDPENLRHEFDEADLMDLGKNVELLGQFDEITVFPLLTDDGGWAGFFDLHDGERRWRAAQLVGIPALRAKVISRPSDEDLLYKKVSRVMQTRSLSPNTKIAGLEKALCQLGLIERPELWDDYRERLGGGQEWPQLVRVLQLKPAVRDMLESGAINFTIAQSVGRLPAGLQAPAAEFIVANKINGRFFSTEMVPYLLEHPEAGLAQAFEHARVGGWRQYTRTPYQKGHEPPLDERVEEFLSACVKWERGWEVVVHTGLVHDISNAASCQFRVRDAARRVAERALALIERIDQDFPENALPPAEAKGQELQRAG